MKNPPTVMITGIHGMDGRLLGDFYYRQGARVIGWARPGDDRPPPPGVVAMVAGSPEDEQAVKQAIVTHRPDHVFHLAAVHHSSQNPLLGGDIDAVALSASMWRLNCLGAVNFINALVHHHPTATLICAGSSQMYQADADQDITVIDEGTPIVPRTDYAVGKAAALSALKFARQNYGLRAAMAILFNHESPLRGPQFVTRKITQAAAQASLGHPSPLDLMNIAARVDWSDAYDIVRGMALMAVAENPKDYVLGSGRLYELRQILTMAFAPLGLDWQDFVTIQADKSEPAFVANPAAAKGDLGWQPTVDMAPVITAMVAADQLKYQAPRF
jgi:GDPmannose 4,6-dehydratase